MLPGSRCCTWARVTQPSQRLNVFSCMLIRGFVSEPNCTNLQLEPVSIVDVGVLDPPRPCPARRGGDAAVRQVVVGGGGTHVVPLREAPVGRRHHRWRRRGRWRHRWRARSVMTQTKAAIDGRMEGGKEGQFSLLALNLMGLFFKR